MGLAGLRSASPSLALEPDSLPAVRFWKWQPKPGTDEVSQCVGQTASAQYTFASAGN